MSTAFADNRAVHDPKRTLTESQQQAIASIAFFRHQRVVDGRWQVGDKRFTTRTIAELCKQDLVKRHGGGLRLTLAGQIVAEKLKGEAHGTA